MKIDKFHHVAIICSDYEQSKHFYVEILGLPIIKKHFGRSVILISWIWGRRSRPNRAIFVS
ncbi:VOC family protein [Trichocoleus sp. FACHB-46]|uniref:VOC family protein n=1 Tax=Trichocoleus desertorum GB2-A4 TaxID=2933944 RepID=A0ABV0J1T4_9CYAN|nr:VOC family protein [Trichocoleus sp. FACHB-46]